MASLLAELIAVRQEIAEYCGYSDYPQFAEDFYFYRDYTAAEEEQLLEDIRRELVPLYRELDAGAWEATGEYASERETLNYLATAAEGMGGTVKEAHDLMKTAKLYDTGYGENKYNSSFEQYLTSYQEPFIFMNATLTAYDKLVLAHEFGHFCNDYASYGSAARGGRVGILLHGHGVSEPVLRRGRPDPGKNGGQPWQLRGAGSVCQL